MAQTRLEYRKALIALADRAVDFIVVGGVSAVLQGAPINTFDLDIVHSRAPENLDRLVLALHELDAHYRLHTKKIAPKTSDLAYPGHHLLNTSAGALDVLGTIADDLGYDELKPYSVAVTIEIGLSVQILRLEKLIEVKEKVGRPKDLAVLMQLRAVLKEQRNADSAGTETPETGQL
jgi:predicted nucleotidyltransferase